MRRLFLSSRGLTLLELLVVIVIICVLIAILLPVTIQLRASAQKAQCISRLQNLWHIHRVYRDSIQDVMYAGNATWVDPLYLLGLLPDPKEINCPSAGNNDVAFYTPGWAPPGGGAKWNTVPYGYTVNLLAFYSRPAINNGTYRSFIGRETRTPLFFDGRIYGLAPAVWSDITNRLAFRHGNKVNTLFLDGHVELLTAEEFLTLEPFPSE